MKPAPAEVVMTETKLQPSTGFCKFLPRGAQWIVGLAFLACVGTLSAQTLFNATSMTPDAAIEKHFQSPPASARPWVFWEWVSLDTSPEAITKDLEEMHAKGIEGVMLFQNSVKAGKMTKARGKMELRGKGYVVVETKDFTDAQIIEVPFQPLVPWSPRQRELLRHVAKESRRLGIKFTLTVGLASTSGAIAPEYGQQKLMWSETVVAGPKDFDALVPVPATNVPDALEPSVHGSWRSPVQFPGHEIALLAVPDKPDVAAADVVNLTDKMDASGRLRWQVPAGKWTIMRFGYMPTGAKNPWGYFTDGMSAEALDKTWDVTIGIAGCSEAPVFSSSGPQVPGGWPLRGARVGSGVGAALRNAVRQSYQ